ncbi:MAG: HEPN domain-containing protein [Ferruginibacter sp.]
MTDILEATGYWHFHSNIENSFAGNLTNDENGEFSVTLLGCTNVPDEPFILHGTTATGKKITLYNCFTSSRRMSFPGIPSVEISAIYCFTGEHLTFESLQFNSAILKISSLNEWVDIGGFNDFTNDDNNFAITYKNPDPITFYKTDSVEFIILFYSTSPYFRPKHNCTVTQDTVILIKHNSTFNLDTFWKYISSIKSFLTLAYFSEPQLQEIKFKQSEKDIECKYVGQKNEISEQKSSRRNFLFTFKNIENDFLTIFKKWTELNVIIEPVINVLQECFGNRNIISENKFLNVMQGIETFHRRRRQNEKEGKVFHKNKVAEIIASCPAEYQDWLKSKLHFSNEPTLNDRLEELFNELDTTLKNHLFNNTEQIISQSKNTRNYFTHYDKSLEKKALKDSELYYLTERLKIFLLIILLKETDIDDEKVKTIVIEGSHFLFNHLIFKAK